MKAMLNMLRQGLRTVLAVYLMLALILFVFQRSLLYYPNDFKPSKEYLQQQRLRYWPSEEGYRGFIAAPETEEAVGTVIVFHGNAATAVHRQFYANALSRVNLRVILAEYPGYGGRDGDPGESVLVADAAETLRLAHQAYGEPLYLWGESLGSGVVSSLVAQTAVPLKGLVLFLPWDSLRSIAQERYWFLPVRWLLLDQYNSIENLAAFKGNVAVLLAGRDEVIPPKHGNKLFQSLNTNKNLWVFDRAGHNSMPIGADLPWWNEVMDFVSHQ